MSSRMFCGHGNGVERNRTELVVAGQEGNYRRNRLVLTEEQAEAGDTREETIYHVQLASASVEPGHSGTLTLT